MCAGLTGSFHVMTDILNTLPHVWLQLVPVIFSLSLLSAHCCPMSQLHGCPQRGQSWHTEPTIGDQHRRQSPAYKRLQCASLNLKVQGLCRTRWKCGDGGSRVLSHPVLRGGLTPQDHASPSPLRQDSVTVPCYRWGDEGTWLLSAGLNKNNGKT